MQVIKAFYNLTIPRFRTNEKKLNKFFNIVTYAEYLFIGKICDGITKSWYPKCQKSLNTEERPRKIVVSLTTIPTRIRTIPVVLKSIFNQTMMPDRIILWISDKIDNRAEIEELLKNEIENGIEIRYIQDVRVHTKYYYAMREFPEDLIITIDDDILYPENLIENLYAVHLKNPNCVIAARAHEMTFSGNKINKYKSWHMLAPGINDDAKCLLATGVGGVLYPPHALYTDWINPEVFLKLCPTADDIWLKVMESLKKTQVIKLYKYTRESFIVSSTQSVALSKQNVDEGRNDRLLNNLIEHYDFDANLFR